MWSDWLVVCDCGLHSLCPLMEKEKRLMEASWWERLTEGETRGNRGWDGWMLSLTQWTWVWVSSGSWWWTGKPGVLESMGSPWAGHNWATELNWTELLPIYMHLLWFGRALWMQDQVWSMFVSLLYEHVLYSGCLIITVAETNKLKLKIHWLSVFLFLRDENTQILILYLKKRVYTV